MEIHTKIFKKSLTKHSTWKIGIVKKIVIIWKKYKYNIVRSQKLEKLID